VTVSPSPLGGSDHRRSQLIPSADPSLLDEPITDCLLPPDGQVLRAHLRAVLAREVAPRAERVDARHKFAGESYQALAGAGLAGVLFPENYGGLGGSTVAYAMAVEEIAAVCGSTSLIYMTQTHAALPLLLVGTAKQRKRYLPGLCAGKLYGSLAISEPDAGSDVASMRTEATRQGDGYILNGSKTFITTGDRADVIVCFATVDRSARQRGITAFLVPGDSEGLRRGRVLAKLGMRGSSTAELFFENLSLPAEARLGGEGEGWSIVMQAVLKSRVSAAAQGVGLARGAYALALGWAWDRGLLGTDERQDVEFRLASLRTEILLRRLALYSVANALDADNGIDLDAQIAMMKLTCTDMGMAVATEAVELLGPIGDLRSSGVERYVRDAKVTQIYDGTNQIQQLLIARDTARRVKARHESGIRIDSL
jgi:alkylation response protein AidB-like acyl-CoA dehydrogenase